MSDIKRYMDVFSLEDHRKINNDMFQAKWKFGHGSFPAGDRRRRYPFWVMGLTEDPYYTEYLLNIIQETTQQEYKLYDVYANGHTFGTMGDFHVDWYDSSEITFLYYANDKWRPDWCGQTIFDLNGQYNYQYPHPNSAISFPGLIPHMSEGVSRSFTGLRVTIAWKLLLK